MVTAGLPSQTMTSGHITKRGESWRVFVDAGSDPIKGPGTRRGESCGLRRTELTKDYSVVEVRSSVVLTREGVVGRETKSDRVRRVAVNRSTGSTPDRATNPST